MQLLLHLIVKDLTQTRYGRIINFNVNLKNWNSSAYNFENSRFLKSIIGNWVILCNETANILNGVSANVASTVSISFDNKKVGHKKIDISFISLYQSP